MWKQQAMQGWEGRPILPHSVLHPRVHHLQEQAPQFLHLSPGPENIRGNKAECQHNTIIQHAIVQNTDDVSLRLSTSWKYKLRPSASSTENG